jgi:hypothetical protein
MKMQRRIWGGVFAVLFAVILAGCGGESKVGVVSGTITDIEGDPVADAEVFAANAVNSRTRSLHNGTYYLTNVPDRFTIIRARAVINGVEYTGQNVAQVFENEQSKNVNIMIAPENRQGGVEGFVRDALGRGIEGARVFAGGALSSAFAVTDRRGFYRITGLPAGYEYPIVASAPDYENDKRTVAIVAGRTTVVSFTLNDSRNRPVQTPFNLSATAWTMPRVLTATRSSPRERDAYNAIRALFDDKPRPRRTVASRATSDYWIEIDLGWKYEEQNSLLGYGIYRGRTIDELNRNAIAFLRDPLANFFADLDPRPAAECDLLLRDGRAEHRLPERPTRHGVGAEQPRERAPVHAHRHHAPVPQRNRGRSHPAVDARAQRRLLSGANLRPLPRLQGRALLPRRPEQPWRSEGVRPSDRAGLHRTATGQWAHLLRRRAGVHQ